MMGAGCRGTSPICAIAPGSVRCPILIDGFARRRDACRHRALERRDRRRAGSRAAAIAVFDPTPPRFGPMRHHPLPAWTGRAPVAMCGVEASVGPPPSPTGPSRRIQTGAGRPLSPFADVFKAEECKAEDRPHPRPSGGRQTSGTSPRAGRRLACPGLVNAEPRVVRRGACLQHGCAHFGEGPRLVRAPCRLAVSPEHQDHRPPGLRKARSHAGNGSGCLSNPAHRAKINPAETRRGLSVARAGPMGAIHECCPERGRSASSGAVGRAVSRTSAPARSPGCSNRRSG
jgi:hypothetical protein